MSRRVWLLALVPLLLVGAWLLWRSFQRQWSEQLLRPGETVLYEEKGLDIHSIGPRNTTVLKDRDVKLTSQRLFILQNEVYIYAVIELDDPTRADALDATVYVPRRSFAIATDDDGRRMLRGGDSNLAFQLYLKDPERARQLF